MRLSSVVVVLGVALAKRRQSPPVVRGDLPPLLGLGVLDLAATTLTSPLLARRFHGERLSGVQAGGVVVVLVGAAFCALG
jgi:drug/metabolite transporter (DMT)-like permease